MTEKKAAKRRPKKKKEPKHQRVRELIRRKIAEGKYKPGSRLPTDTELPKIFKVGRQTVLRALSDLSREGLIVRRRGSGSYVAEGNQPPILPGRNLHFGLLWPEDVGPQYLHERAHGLMTLDALSTWGVDHVSPDWRVPGPFEGTSGTWIPKDRGLKVTALGQAFRSRTQHPEIEIIQAGRFDGLVALSIIENDWLAEVLALGIPTVLADYASDHFRHEADQVFHDPSPGYREAIRYFASKGLKRIHFLGCDRYLAAPEKNMDPQQWLAFTKGKQRPDPDSIIRLSAYRQGMQECDLSVREDWIHHLFHDQEACIQLGQQLAQRPKTERPEAIVCHGVAQAEWVIEGFAGRGLTLMGAGATAPLNTGKGKALSVCANVQEMGAVAAELLVSRMHRPRRSVFRVGIPMYFDPDGTGKPKSASEIK